MSGVSRILATLLGVAAAAVIGIIVFGGDDGYEVKVQMPDAYGVRKNSSVKIAGANGGKVKKAEVIRVGGPNGRDIAELTLKMKDDAGRIGPNAKVTVRPTDLLGERYIALDPGDLSKPQPSGTVIPVSRVSAPVELDQILNSFTPTVRGKMRVLINEFGVALTGRGTDFNKLLAELPTSLDKARLLTGQLADENVNLKRLVTSGDRTLTRVNSKRGDLNRFLVQFDRSINVFRNSREDIEAAVQRAPGGLSQLTATMNTLTSTSNALTPASDALRRTAAPLTSTLRVLPSFQKAAEDTLVSARQASPSLTRLAKGGRTPIKALRPTTRDIDTLLTHSAPTLETIRKRADKDLLHIIQSLSRWFKPRDSLTHTAGVNLNVPPEMLRNIVDSYINAFTKKKTTTQRKSEPTKPATPAPKSSEPAPSSPTAPSPAPDKPQLVKLPEIKLPKLPLLDDLPATLSQLPEVVKNLPKQILDALPKVDETLKKTLDGVEDLTNNLTGRNGQENSDAMGLFDYLFAP